MNDVTMVQIDQTIDARGMPCPGPLMSLIGAIRAAPVGHVVEVLSSDVGSKADIPAWVAKAGHALVQTIDVESYARFVVRKER